MAERPNSFSKAADDTPKDYKKIFAKYPKTDDGFCVSFKVDDGTALDYLEEYGFVVIQVLNEAECDASVRGFFEEMNSQASPSQKKPITKDDPSSWEDENWPAPASRFLTKTMAIHQQAWNNRCHRNLHRFFTQVFKTNKLWASIDRWGFMRGTKYLEWPLEEDPSQFTIVDKPEWTNVIQPHWDVNPWLHCASLAKRLPEMYQGVLALDDCPEATGGFLGVPHSAEYTRTWVKENKQTHDKDVITRLPDHDPMVSHLQRITLRRGEAVIWNVLTAHATFPNTSNVPRIVQYVRMMPATSDSEARDRYAAPSMLKTDKVVLDSLKTIQLTDAQKRLLGLMPWPK